MNPTPFFSIIVPIYNRPDEARELLESLAAQTDRDFELVLVEDGSTRPCAAEVEAFRSRLTIHYIVKPNTGRSDSRNVGMRASHGAYLIFFDSDCIIPPDYFATVRRYLATEPADCFGGPDREHPSFTPTQKAISYAMTSFWTTGGIRGGRTNLEKFKPRTFNMGFSREVYERVGGFKDMYGEDIDLSLRIHQAGFTTRLYRDAYVYHKRRGNLRKFYRQHRPSRRRRLADPDLRLRTRLPPLVCRQDHPPPRPRRPRDPQAGVQVRFGACMLNTVSRGI